MSNEQRKPTPLEEGMRMRAAVRNEMHRAEQNEQAQRRAQGERFEQAAQGAVETIGWLPESMAERAQFAPVVRGLDEAVTVLRAGLYDLQRIAASKTITDGQRITALGERGKSAQGATLGKVKDAAAKVAALADDVERRRKVALTSPAAIAGQLGEVRAVLRGMDAAERAKVLKEARGDESNLLTYAVACAPAFVSGADAGQHYTAVSTVFGLRDPELLYLLDEVPKAQAVVQRALETVPRLLATLVDFDAADAMGG